MKTKKEDTLSMKSSKSKILRPKAGASLEQAVKNVQQIIKKRKKTEIISVERKKPSLIKHKSRQFKKPRQSRNKGIVYIGHIPHGFYEEQMEDYFKQFGKVTRVRVARSKKTGRSRGYGYVEFLIPEVAKIAAESMNNYLMCGRLLKTTYIPPEKQHPRFFLGLNWSEDKYPKLKKREKAILQKNAVQSSEDHENYTRRVLSKLSALESKLQNQGISIKFQPVDVPET